MINLNIHFEKYATCWRYGLTLALLLVSSFSMIQAQSCTEKTLVRYNLDDCESFSSNGTNTDFSEFDPAFPNTAGCLSINAANISNQMGGHSCVAGANGSTAGICVEGHPGYSFVNNDDDAVRFSITVEPGQTGWITELSFYQYSPIQYQHIAGNTGENKYLQKFGVRILKNGSEVFKSTGFNTNQNNWELETFDLSNDSDFEITTTSTFTFEILGYRPISSGTPHFFDVDNIKLKGCCQTAPCFANGGDNDNDGVCANQDCDDNNPNVPAAVGSACNDGNANTDYDVIQGDGCSCAGTPIAAGPDCNDISITTGNGSITVTGLDGAPVTSLQIFTSSWQQEFSCFANCSATETVTVASGSYKVYVKYYNASYGLICQVVQDVTVGGGGCNDADNDGTCDDDDCQPYNPAFPATVGSACNDGNPNTENDVVGNDGCSCAGTPVGNQPDCNDIVITTEPGKIIVSGLDGAPISSLQIFNSSWQQEFSCFADCSAMEMIDLPAGDYYVYAKYYTADYSLICQVNPTITVIGGGCADADNDGTCDVNDCQPNNPAFPATPGTSCNDGNPNTVNDVIQGDGCSCAGTFDACANAGGDNDNDGVCAAQDCDDNNPNLPATPGTSCNDGNANTINDVIQSDGCSCAGTAPVVTVENCGNNCFIYTGNVDYKALGNSMNYSEAQDNCNKKSNSSAYLGVPSGSTIVSAILHWSGSGSLDSSVKLNGQTVYADQTFTNYTNPYYFFGAYADVTAQVQNNGNYTVSGLSWDNTSSYCQGNAAYGAWSIVVVYSNANNDNSRVHVCQDIFDFTFPEGTYNGSLQCVDATPGCSPNAELTFITFESDGYKGEYLYIGGQYFGDNNFNGQTAPNLDIATFTLNNAFNTNSSSLNYSIQSYLTNTVWGTAAEGLFDFVKVLKYDVCNAPVNMVSTPNNGIDAFTAEERMTPLNKSTTEQSDEITENVIDNTNATAVDIRLFPNPAGNFVNLDLSSVYGENVEVHFYNSLGQQVKTVQVTEAADDLKIDLDQLNDGLYNVLIQTDNHRPIIKQLVISKF